MKPKSTLAAVLSTTAIASGVLLASVSSAQPCSLSKSFHYKERYEQANWLRTPLAAIVALPGIAIAAALSLGNRYYRG
jgi:hypothetical protein